MGVTLDQLCSSHILFLGRQSYFLHTEFEENYHNSTYILNSELNLTSITRKCRRPAPLLGTLWGRQSSAVSLYNATWAPWMHTEVAVRTLWKLCTECCILICVLIAILRSCNTQLKRWSLRSQFACAVYIRIHMKFAKKKQNINIQISIKIAMTDSRQKICMNI